MLIICRNVNSYYSHSACNQTVAKAADGRSEAGGNLAEEKEPLSLAWREVGGGLVVKDKRLMAALVESFGRQSRCGRKKKPVYRGERKVHGGSRWPIGGRLVAYCGGAGGGEAGGGEAGDEGGGG